jgi:hypothetical protein
MKTQIKNAGFVFPSAGFSSGMTLRDYFAVQALAGIMAGNYTSNSLKWVPGEAYALADAMLAARERKEDAP